jgi:hypothetical protein
MQSRTAIVCFFAIGLFATEASPFVRDRNPHAFVLAGERIRFDANLMPQFTDKQIHESAEATRAGLAKWASTDHGRRFIARFNRDEYEVLITENWMEEGIGRAPQPGLATLVAASDHSKIKAYDLILNPTFNIPRSVTNIYPSRQPATPADQMAAAWAGEMLHIYFYSNGISLPHHQRADFQQEWHLMAAELGLPNMPHADDDED